MATVETYDLLKHLCYRMDPELVIETGTADGYGTRVLREASRGVIVTCDNHPPAEQRRLKDVQYVVDDSLALAQQVEDIDLAFVDCGTGHQRAAVVETLRPKTRVVVVDDTSRFPILPLIEDPPDFEGTNVAVWARDKSDRLMLKEVADG